ncbi:MAG: DUF1269 domain-containing protein [Anaerolineae bacterium]|nr:DUF1269 domain-containing protein [Anaerolineae bacterium]
MEALTVWKFNTVEGAGQALKKLESLSKQELVAIEDAAIVYWETGKKKPKTHQAQSLTGVGALGGAFWGMLFGLLFFIPFFGLAVGAATGALIGHFSDYGIDDKFIKEVRSEVTEGTSALFLLTASATVDKVQDAFAGTKMELIRSNLTKEQEAKLREDFAG